MTRIAAGDPALWQQILTANRAAVTGLLREVRADLDRSQGRDTYARELKRHGVESVERELSWLAELIAAERGAGPADAPASPVNETPPASS